MRKTIKNNSFYSGGFQERQAGRDKREEEAGNRETLSTWEEAAGVAVRRQGQMEDIRVARELLSRPSIETGSRDEEEWGYGGRRMAGGGGDGRSSRNLRYQRWAGLLSAVDPRHLGRCCRVLGRRMKINHPGVG